MHEPTRVMLPGVLHYTARKPDATGSDIFFTAFKAETDVFIIDWSRGGYEEATIVLSETCYFSGEGLPTAAGSIRRQRLDMGDSLTVVIPQEVS